MNFSELINITFIFFLNFLNSMIFYIILSVIILIYFLITICFLDRKKIKKIRSFQDDYNPILKELKAQPLVNIIIPAWKENETFRDCLLSITKLSYPNLKIIVNAGGNEETVNIANSFKKYENFIILKQEKGGGKVKAINNSLKYVSEGLIYFIDADFYLQDEIFIKMIYQIINENENVVCSSLKPYKFQENKDLVKYIYINRYSRSKGKRGRYLNAISPHTCFKYDAIKSINKFPEKQLSDDNTAMGREVVNKGYKIYRIPRFVETYYPDTVKKYIRQNTRWIQNNLMKFYGKNKKRLIITIFYIIASIYLFVFPFLILINFGLFMIGVFLFLIFYINKIRFYLIFKKTFEKNSFQKTSFLYFLKLIYYIYLDIIINVLSIIELIFNRKKYKERKNIK